MYNSVLKSNCYKKKSQNLFKEVITSVCYFLCKKMLSCTFFCLNKPILEKIKIKMFIKKTVIFADFVCSWVFKISKCF